MNRKNKLFWLLCALLLIMLSKMNFSKMSTQKELMPLSKKCYQLWALKIKDICQKGIKLEVIKNIKVKEMEIDPFTLLCRSALSISENFRFYLLDEKIEQERLKREILVNNNSVMDKFRLEYIENLMPPFLYFQIFSKDKFLGELFNKQFYKYYKIIPTKEEEEWLNNLKNSESKENNISREIPKWIIEVNYEKIIVETDKKNNLIAIGVKMNPPYEDLYMRIVFLNWELECNH